MEMEALLANLHLTGISSAREVVGYGPRDPQHAAQVLTSDIGTVSDPEVDRERLPDDEDPFRPDLWEGECG